MCWGAGQLSSVPPQPSSLCPPHSWQVFGKGNTAFWIVFSVIHIISTLLLSIQLYYMGRWKLGERMRRAGRGEGPAGPHGTKGWGPGSQETGDLPAHGDLEESLELGEAGLCSAVTGQRPGKDGHLPFSLQTRGSAVASSTCSTQTASGSAAGPSMWYLSCPPPTPHPRSRAPGLGEGLELRFQGGGPPLTWSFSCFSPVSVPLSVPVSLSPQDRMVLLVMGNIINWSL